MYLYDSVWQAEYTGDGVWEVRATEGSVGSEEEPEDKRLVWDVYEQTASVVATGKYQTPPHAAWLPNTCFDIHIRNDERR